MSASYERLIEELYTTDKSKLESALESDVKEILSDKNTRKLLKEFIIRLDKDSNIEPNSMKSIRYYEVLLRINNIEEFNQEQEELQCFCHNQSDLNKVVDDSSLNKFAEEQKLKIHRKVDESHEYRRFKEYLKTKYQTRRSRRVR